MATELGQGPTTDDVSALERRKLALEDCDDTWELKIRHEFLKSKRKEYNQMKTSIFHTGFTQWELHALLCGGFLSQFVISILYGYGLPILISLYIFLLLIQIRLQRDKYTLYTSISSLSLYAVLLIIVHAVSDKRHHFPVLLALLVLALIHLVTSFVLGKYTRGFFEQFSDSQVQIHIPCAKQFHGGLIGLISTLSTAFTAARLYYLSYCGFVTVIFSCFARLTFSSSLHGQNTEYNHQEGHQGCLPVVRNSLSIIFTISATGVSIASLFEGNPISVKKQESFLTWLSNQNIHNEGHLAKINGLVHVFVLTLILLVMVDALFLVHMIYQTKILDSLLHSRLIIQGRVACQAKLDRIYSYIIYTLASNGRVKHVESIYKKELKNKSDYPITCMDVYFKMVQLAASNNHSKPLYCRLDAKIPAYGSELENNPLVKCRLLLNEWNRQLGDLCRIECQNRNAFKRQRHLQWLHEQRLKQLPKFVSKSLPMEVEEAICTLANPSHNTRKYRRDSHETSSRSMSIPVNLSLTRISEMPKIVNVSKRLLMERCKTTSVTDQYMHQRGIIDRVKGSWLTESREYACTSRYTPYSTPRIGNVSVSRVDGDFSKIDQVLEGIFNNLEIYKDHVVPNEKFLFIDPIDQLGQVNSLEQGYPKCIEIPESPIGTAIDTSWFDQTISEILASCTTSRVDPEDPLTLRKPGTSNAVILIPEEQHQKHVIDATPNFLDTTPMLQQLQSRRFHGDATVQNLTRYYEDYTKEPPAPEPRARIIPQNPQVSTNMFQTSLAPKPKSPPKPIRLAPRSRTQTVPGTLATTKTPRARANTTGIESLTPLERAPTNTRLKQRSNSKITSVKVPNAEVGSAKISNHSLPRCVCEHQSRQSFSASLREELRLQERLEHCMDQLPLALEHPRDVNFQDSAKDLEKRPNFYRINYPSIDNAQVLDCMGGMAGVQVASSGGVSGKNRIHSSSSSSVHDSESSIGSIGDFRGDHSIRSMVTRMLNETQTPSPTESIMRELLQDIDISDTGSEESFDFILKSKP
ncbi:hypothetical protein BdWA1_002216 [Babesia duncani]|uniref:Uncharacterized protein n=1 Tax=Babesia duncani TaxID=323732 RepID=A0AAD9PM54_9APIC|nr:hypothetical protein BdWA1_002216 [Babesia duncani]